MVFPNSHPQIYEKLLKTWYVALKGEILVERGRKRIGIPGIFAIFLEQMPLTFDLQIIKQKALFLFECSFGNVIILK